MAAQQLLKTQKKLMRFVFYESSPMYYTSRCGHPGQQHGRRFPAISCDFALSICSFLVSSFFGEIIQQIHSLRASGVISFQAAKVALEPVSIFLKSGGTLWTTPVEILGMGRL